MQQNDLKSKVINTLNNSAKNHQRQHIVMQNVFTQIDQNTHSKFNRWGLSGFALAAAITGIAVMPSTFLGEPTNEAHAVANAKLSPQLAEDLEMLLVLGEDTIHGS